jgi:hypothetical protein
LAGEQLGDRQQQAEREQLLLAGDAGLLLAEQLGRPERELQAGLVLHPEPREGRLVQRLVGERPAERDPRVE